MSRTPANKTLLGFAIAVLLAILSALGYQLPKWLTGTRAPTSSDLPTTAGSFSTAKDWLYEKIYYDQPKTFYCGCDYPLTGDRAGPEDASAGFSLTKRIKTMSSRTPPARVKLAGRSSPGGEAASKTGCTY
jgi:hypothetical protein